MNKKTEQKIKAVEDKETKKGIFYEHAHAKLYANGDKIDYVYEVKREYLEALLKGDINGLIFDTRYYGDEEFGDIHIEVEA